MLSWVLRADARVRGEDVAETRADAEQRGGDDAELRAMNVIDKREPELEGTRDVLRIRSARGNNRHAHTNKKREKERRASSTSTA